MKNAPGNVLCASGLALALPRFRFGIFRISFVGLGGASMRVVGCFGAFSESGSSVQKKGLLTVVPRSSRVILLL